MSLIKRILTPSKSPSVPRGVRVYAIGDIHGRSDLLRQLLAKVEHDQRENKVRRSIFVFLGDYIDRGPGSSDVLDRLIALRRSDAIEAYFLMGNHEEVLLRILAGDTAIYRDWVRFGGRECLLSYGITEEELDQSDVTKMPARIRALIRRSHRAFLSDLADTVRVGDYLFVHAGLRPGLSLSAQSQDDMRWIRSPFLDNEDADYGYTVVHGHTISDNVVWKRNRIGIDTGAYASGKLTALVLEGSDRRLIQTDGVPDQP